MKKAMKAIVALAVAMGMAFGALAGTTVKLGNVKSDMTIADGTTLKGVLGGKAKLSIADGATVTLNSVMITNTMDAASESAGLTCLGDATIMLKTDTENVIGGSANYPAIYVPKGKTLTIKGKGSLFAQGGSDAAGIGAGSTVACGNIVIESGDITAYPGTEYPSTGAAAIGGGVNASCGNITITGGKIKAMAGLEQDFYTYTQGSQTFNGIGNGTGKSKCGKVYLNGGDIQLVAYDGCPIGDNCASVKVGSGIGKLDLIGKKRSWLAGLDDTMFDKHLKKAGPYEGYGGKRDGWSITHGDIIDFNPWYTVRVTSYLGGLSGSKTIKDGDYVTGELLGDYKLSLAKGATVVFENVKIGDSLESDMPGVTCANSATNIIVVQGDNYIKGHGDCYPGIFVPKDCMLDIRTVAPGTTPKSIGSLTAVSGGTGGAGIGGCHPDIDVKASSPYKQPCGRVVIYGGRITAKGGSRAIAIGGRFKSTATSKTIKKHGKIPAVFCGTIRTEGGVPTKAKDLEFLYDRLWGWFNSTTFGLTYTDLDEWADSDTNMFIDDNGVKQVATGDDSQLFAWSGSLTSINSSSKIGCVEAIDGTTIGGRLFVCARISIVPNATVTLSDASIVWRGSYITEDGKEVCRRGDYAGLVCDGDATIILASHSQNAINLEVPDVDGYDYGEEVPPEIRDNGYSPGIYVPKGHTLTIDGDGGLAVAGGDEAAGIGTGGGSMRNCGKIDIRNGVITSMGGMWSHGLGIGGDGDEGKCDGVSILGGLVIAVAGGRENRVFASSLKLEIADHLERRDGEARSYDVIPGAHRFGGENRYSYGPQYMVESVLGHFLVYDDNVCSIIGIAEDITKIKRPGRGGTPPHAQRTSRPPSA